MLLAAFALSMLAACSKTDFSATENEDDLGEAISGLPSQRACEADNILFAQMAADPDFKKNIEELERHTAQFIADSRQGIIRLSSATIPVVVNVLYRTSAENISNAQIQSQIDILNADFNAMNSEYSSVPALFAGAKADVDISFTLQNVIRKSTTKRSWRTNDDMKKANKGGIAYTPGALNIWVCTLSGGILGYAQFPGGNAATDGVVLLNTATGNTGTAAAPFDLGRTATHEVGHWLNLRHIWGDATCGNDFVGDTPLHNTANYGCPAASHKSTCTGTPYEMTMNYMDYTDDACMYMFSVGQKDRMLATFAPGGPRAAFAN